MSAMDNAHQEPIDEENPADLPPPPPPPGEIILTDETQSLLNLFRSVVLTPQEKHMRSKLLVSLMTTDSEEGEDASQFTEMISRLDELQLQNMASLLTLHTSYFLKIARNKNGSQRIVNLLGQSDDRDTFFFLAIMRCFSRVMTHKQAAHVGITGMQVFEEEKREIMYKHIVEDAIDLACNKCGCYVLNYIMTELGNFGDRLPDEIAINALRLSNHAYGNYVVQNVLKKNELLYTSRVAKELKGHFVELSFQKHGCYVVEKILETKQPEIMEIVADEFLLCERDDLTKLAKDKYGHFVVQKILGLTTDVSKFNQLCRKIIAATYSK